MAYIIHILTLVGIYSIMVMGFNLSAGMAGLMNLSHMTFAAIGGYTSAILTSRYDLNWILAFVAGILVAILSSFIWSVLAARMEGDQFALISLMIGIVVYIIALNWKELTRGALGIAGLQRPDFASSMEQYALLVWLCVVVCYGFVQKIEHSPFGRALTAIRDDSIAARVLGKNVAMLRVKTLMISAGIAGSAGVLFAHYIQFLQPRSLYLETLIILLAALVIGGLGSTKGAIAGVFIMFLIAEPLRFLPIPDAIVGALRLMIYALLMIIVILKKPRGLFGKIAFDV